MTKTGVITPDGLLVMIENWEPPAKPHCSNCLFAKISGYPSNPVATCAKGFGKPLDLWTLIRHSRPRQFTPAADCDDYTDMGGPCNLGAR